MQKGGAGMRNMAEMLYYLGLKVKIYPSNRQKHLIAVNDGAGRAVYNHLVACGNEWYRMKKSSGFCPCILGTPGLPVLRLRCGKGYQERPPFPVWERGG